MKSLVSPSPLRASPWLALLLGLPLAASAQLTLTSLSPTRNLRNAPRATNVVLTFSQAISAGTAGNLRVFSQQRGGQLNRAGGGVLTGGGTNTITFNPANDFRPGEDIFVSAPPTMQNTSGQPLFDKQAYQFTAAAGGTGPGTFQTPASNGNFSVGSTPYTVIAVDVDNDADLDMVTVNSNANGVDVRRNNGSGVFGAATFVPTGSSPWGVTAADMDNDGDLDLLTTNQSASNVRISLNNGSGTFSAGATVAVSASPAGIAAGDFDADGDIDFVTACTSPNAISVVVNDGNGAFGFINILSAPTNCFNVTMGDVDNDGDLDLITVGDLPSGAGVAAIYRNNGSGSFAAAVNVAVGGSPQEVATADVDGDGDRDLLVTNKDANTVSVRLNNSGTFSGGSDVAVDDAPYELAVADVDADGDLDLLAGCYLDPFISVRLNDGSGGYSGQYRVQINSAAWSITTGDLDGDGDIDLLSVDDSNTGCVRLNAPIPALTSISSTAGPVGSTVTLTGTLLTGATAVSFNGTAATSFTVNSATQITATVPAGASSGDVTVTTPGGTTNGVSFTVTFALTGLSPTRNAVAAPRSTNVALTYAQPIAPNTAGVRVYSAQRGGQLAYNLNVATSGNTITVNPDQDFRPGETVFVTSPSTVQSTTGQQALAQVYQFTAAAGGSGRGTFASAPVGTIGVGSAPGGVRAADVDGDGDLDLLVTNYSSNSVSILTNNGGGTLSSTGTVAVGSTPVGLTVGDVDGDGDLDLLTANGAGTVTVALNNGVGSFGSIRTVAVGLNPNTVALGDVDGDGDLDLFCSNRSSNSVSVRLNEGSGNFTAGSSEVSVGTQPSSVAVGDLDGDGDLDLVATNQGDNTASVRLNDGAGAFSSAATVTVGPSPISVALANIDGDGDLDLLVTNNGGSNVFVRRNNGSGSFSGSTNLAVGLSPVSTVAADVDADGDLDLLTTNSGNNTVTVQRNDGAGNFSGAYTVAVGSSPSNLTTADLDGDGDLDLATADNGSNTVSVRLNVSTPTLTSISPSSSPVGGVLTLTGADFTGATAVSFNGLPAATFTVVSPTQITVTVPVGVTNGPVTVITPLGTSNSLPFTRTMGITSLAPARNARAAPRATNVGITFDQSVAAGTAANVRVYSQQRGGQLVRGGNAAASGSTLTVNPAQDLRAGETVFVTVPATVQGTSGAAAVPQVYQFTAAAPGTGVGTFGGGGNYAVGAGPRGVTAADIDSDGDLDLLTANEAVDAVSVRLNNGSGAFSNAADVAVGDAPQNVVATDLDNDGDLDLLVANGFANTVSVRFNNGLGTFSGTTDVPVASAPWMVAAADVDADGDLDMLTANRFAHSVSVRLNDGTGTFSGTTEVLVDNEARGIAVGDVDSDGDIDVLTANYTGNTVSVRLNDGTGAFGGGSEVTGGNTTTSVALADVDGDGDLDLLSANSGSSTVNVRLNNGSGTFSGGSNVQAGGATSVATGDIDGDGDLDFVASGFSGNFVAVRFNNGNGTFSGASAASVSSGPWGVVLADLNGDNDLDLAAAGYNGAANVFVRFNTAPAPTLTILSPTSGLIGTSVTLTGTTFSVLSTVSFNGIPATSVTYNSATSLTVVVPPAALSGPVTVTTPDGTSNGVNFTVISTLSVASLSPARNTVAAPRATNVGITFNQVIDATTAGTVRVQSQQRGGQLVRGGNVTASGNTLTVDPAQDFKPGETAFVTVPNGVLSPAGERVNPQVYQFTAATGGPGQGEYRGGTDYFLGVGTSPRSVTAADVDGDGDLDMLAVGEGSGNVRIWLNNGAGIFSNTRPDVTAGSGAQNAVATDIDNDGDLDLLIANGNATTVSVRVNNGAGYFSGTGNVAVGSSPWMVAAADVDADGDQDMLTANRLGNSVSVRFNDGAGAFSGTTEVPVGNEPWGIAVGDVDSDGDIDVLTANYNGSSVSVRLNNGSGAFGGGSEVPASIFTTGVAIGDVDGDHDLDLLIASGSGSAVNVRLNNGSGTFSGGSDVAAGANPVTVTTGDVDADGDLDLAFTNFNNNTVYVRLNNGTGTFGGNVSVGVSNGPWGLVLADLDGDLDLDLLSAGYNGSNRVSVRFNEPSLRGTVTISSTATSPTATSPIPVSVLFNERVTGFVASDVTVGNGAITGGSFGGSGRLYTFTVTPTAPGLVTVNVPAGVAQDSAGGNNLAAPQFSITYSPVTVTAMTRDLPSPAATATVSYTVTFSGTVTGLSAGNFSLTTTGLTGASVGTVTGSGATYVVTVNTGTGNGTLRLDLANTTGLTPTVTVPYTSGPAYTITRTLSSAALSIQGTGGTGSDVTAFVDAVQLLDATTSAPLSGSVANPGFETHDPLTNGNYGYTPTGASWTFGGQSGIAENGSAFAPPTTSDGVAVAFVQNVGQISQTLTPSSGSVKVRFLAGQRACCSTNDQALNVFVDGVFVGRIQPANNNAYTTFTSGAFTVPVAVTDLTISTTGQTIAAGTYNSVTITGTGEATLSGSVTVNTALVVQSGGRLNTACQPLTGPGTFTLAAGATLSICDAAGITGSGATGAVQTTGARIFASDASYIYNGTVAQVTGSGLPTPVRELETANPAGVTLTRATAVTRVLRLTAGTLTTNGNTLTLLSTAAGTAYAVHAGGLTNGPVTVQRYVPSPTAVSYHHLSSPVQAALVSDLATTGFVPKVNPAYNNLPYVAPPAATYPNVFGFDEARGGTTAAYQDFTTGYESPATLGTTLTPGRGYSVAIGGVKTPDFVGTLTNGSINVTLSHTGINTASNKAGWQLLGNPYPQPIDWDLLTTPANVEASVYVWYSTGGSNGAYRVRNASGVGNLTNGLIGLGQGLWVRTTAPATFSFTNALRVEDYAVPLGRQAAGGAAQRPLLTLTLAQAGAPAGQQDEVTIYEQSGATTGFDGAFDAVRPGRNVGVPTLSALIGGQEAIISALPAASLTAGTTVELLLDLPAVGSYSLGVGELTNLDGTTLLDRVTGTRYDLATQPVVTFHSGAAGESRGRFALVFGQRPTGTADDAAVLSFTLAPNPAHGAVRLHNAAAETATLLDATGRTVRTWTLAPGTTADLSLAGLAPGVYSVRVGAASRRLVIE